MIHTPHPFVDIRVFRGFVSKSLVILTEFSSLTIPLRKTSSRPSTVPRVSLLDFIYNSGFDNINKQEVSKPMSELYQS